MSEGIIIRAAHYPGRAPIDAYGKGGFRFADMSHKGSILCLPSGIHGWDASDPKGFAATDFQRAIDEAGEIDILLVGTGRDLVPLPRALKEALREIGRASCRERV